MRCPPYFLTLAQMPTPPEFRPPAGLLPEVNTPWWLYAACTAALLLIAALAWWLSRRRPSAIPAPTPADQARSSISRLRQDGGLLPPDDFASAICDTVRAFFEAEFSLRATRQTSQEFLAGVVSNHNIPGRIHAPLAEFLEAVDVVRYGPPHTSNLDRELLATAAMSLVDAASPRATKTESGVAA